MTDLLRLLQSVPDCKCAARSASECAFDASWPEDYIKEAADEIRRLRLALEGISSCSTCDVCRGAAILALRAAIHPAVATEVNDRHSRSG